MKGQRLPWSSCGWKAPWGSIFSFSEGKFFFKRPKNLRRQLTLHISDPRWRRTRRWNRSEAASKKLGADAAIRRRDDYLILAKRIIRTWRRRGRKLQAADSLGTTAGGRALLTRVLVLRRALRREILSDDETHIGVLLPPSVAGVAVNIALALDRKDRAANLNYTVSSNVINHCINDVGIKHVLTSEKFCEKIDVEVETEVVKLESLKDKVTTMDKLIGVIQANLLPAFMLDWILGLNQIKSDDLLTVIFTSGSTGMPKGVQLSNANISHNVEAIDRAVKLGSEDTALGILPFFHSFGYSVTLWAVNILGPAGVYHFNPLDAKQVGKLAEKYKASVLLATPTFLKGYMRRIQPEQFANLTWSLWAGEDA